MGLIEDGFSAASPFLKKMLKRPELAEHISDWACLDMPCGEGRNTFLLGSLSKKVMAMDINASFLQLIDEQKVGDVINTAKIDINSSELMEAAMYDLVCAIHFYAEGFIENLLKQMRKGAYLLIETPACHGENFRGLPNQRELSRLFHKDQVLYDDFKKCNGLNNDQARGSYKALIKIDRWLRP